MEDNFSLKLFLSKVTETFSMLCDFTWECCFSYFLCWLRLMLPVSYLDVGLTRGVKPESGFSQFLVLIQTAL